MHDHPFLILIGLLGALTGSVLGYQMGNTRNGAIFGMAVGMTIGFIIEVASANRGPRKPRLPRQQGSSPRSTIDHLVQNLGGETRFQAATAKAQPQGEQKKIFEALSLGQFLRSMGGSLVLGVVLLALILLIIPIVFHQVDARTIFAVQLGVLVLFSIDWLWQLTSGYLRSQQEKVVMERGRFIEHGLFNHKRAFTYTQIYEVRLDRNERCCIRYYIYDENMQINYRYVREAYLITVSNPSQMAEELQRRISAPQPDGETKSRFLHRTGGLQLLVFLGGFLLFIAVSWLMTVLPFVELRRTLFLSWFIIWIIAWIATTGWLGISFWIEHYYREGMPNTR